MEINIEPRTKLTEICPTDFDKGVKAKQEGQTFKRTVLDQLVSVARQT